MNKNTSNQKRAEQLGMPFGTASHKLRKLVMFMLVQETNKDYCFKCSKQIKTVEELSIEHKKAWFNISPELFWKLDNIAFSHLKCNRPDNPNYGSNRIVCPKGTSWCVRCNKFLHTDLFYKDAHSTDGFSSYCKEHDEEKRKQRRANRKASGLVVQ